MLFTTNRFIYAGLTLLCVLCALALPSQSAAKTSSKSSKYAKKTTVTAKSAKKQAGIVANSKSRVSRSISVRKVVWVNGKRRSIVLARSAVFVPAAPARLSVAQMQGLHGMQDPLELRSSVALVTDQVTGEVLFSKNDHAVLPIASITKLMTALVTLEAKLPLTDPIMISDEDIDQERNSRSRLKVGAQLSRGDALHLALMASENRAAHALSRHYPGGTPAFVQAMNARAKVLGMQQTSFNDPTGLSSSNVSSAHDLAVLMNAAYGHANIRQWSTSHELTVDVAGRGVAFSNTNSLTKNPEWEIGLQKTGFIAEAGKCLVMQARIEGRAVLMVFLDSVGKYSRLGDAQRVRSWLESGAATAMPASQPVGKAA